MIDLANANLQNGEDALLAACKAGEIELVRILIANGARPSEKHAQYFEQSATAIQLPSLLDLCSNVITTQCNLVPFWALPIPEEVTSQCNDFLTQPRS